MTLRGSSAPPRSLRIAHLSDLHLTAPGNSGPAGVEPANKLVLVVAAVNALRPRPDLVLVTGDLSHQGRDEELAQARRILSSLEMPYWVVPGNHDRRAPLKAAFGYRTGGADGGFVQYSIAGHDLRLIGLDTTDPGRAGGVFCARRADWLESCLAEEPERPSVLFLHHPPPRLGVDETDNDGFEGADRLGAIITRFPCIEALFCGHIHLTSFSTWRGISVVTAPAAGGMELAPDFTLRRASGFRDVEPAFLLHVRQGDGAHGDGRDVNWIHHQIIVREHDHVHEF